MNSITKALQTAFPTFAGKSVDAKIQKSRPAFMRFPAQEQAHFAKRLAMVLRSGIPIMEGLVMLSSQNQNRASAYIYQELIMHVSNGQPLSVGMRSFANIFGDFSINIVKVGETSGTLHENLDYLAEELKKKTALKKKVVGSLVYPAVIVFATVGISLVLTMYIFPKITPIFASFSTELPLTTRLLMNFSNFLVKDGVLALLGVIAVCFAYGFSLRLKSFHLVIDHILLRLPLFGKMSQYYNISNMCRTLSLLLKSDVGIVMALSIVADSTKNLAYRNAIRDIEREVMKGQKISGELLLRSELFPPIMSQMILVGERTGNLSDSLMYVSNMYEEEISDLTKNLTTMIEPVLMVVMGLVVGFIAISIITPIYGITQQLTPH